MEINRHSDLLRSLKFESPESVKNYLVSQLQGNNDGYYIFFGRRPNHGKVSEEYFLRMKEYSLQNNGRIYFDEGFEFACLMFAKNIQAMEVLYMSWWGSYENCGMIYLGTPIEIDLESFICVYWKDLLESIEPCSYWYNGIEENVLWNARNYDSFQMDNTSPQPNK